MPPNLWIQALTEASDDPEIRKYLRKQMREVHDFVADVIRRAQEAGGVSADRDPSAEAWIFIAIGLLGTVGRRVGGLVDEDFTQIFNSRRQWMTGEVDLPPAPKVARRVAPTTRRSTATAVRDAVLFVAESLLSASPGPVARDQKGRPPAAAPGTLIWRRSPTFGASPTIRGDDPEAFGSAAQPTPPGLTSPICGAPLAVSGLASRPRCKVNRTIELDFR